MDDNGYPTDEEIERIKSWHWDDFMGLMQFIENECWSSCGSFKRTGRRFRLATGGWSGNEEVISALNKNPMFDALCWQSSRRGGLHIFHVPKIKGRITK